MTTIEHQTSVLIVSPCRSTLVNEALLRYFLSECHITHHFNVIKWFLLLEDGEFGHALSTRLCEELTHGRDWRVLVSPSFLNPLLSTALEVSVHSRCPEAQRISFALKYRPTSLNTHGGHVQLLEILAPLHKFTPLKNVVYVIKRENVDSYLLALADHLLLVSCTIIIQSWYICLYKSTAGIHHDTTGIGLIYHTPYSRTL